MVLQRYHPTTPWRRAIEAQFFKPFPPLKSRFHLYPCRLPQLAADELSETEAANMKRWWRTSGDRNPARACARWIHLTPGSYKVCLIICDSKESNFYKQAECTHRNRLVTSGRGRLSDTFNALINSMHKSCAIAIVD